ncbi:post-GPI attachment to proteins factor 4 [Patella vulgata]|uniref:post-GPI attachment to proteins factor 4 n=1 Tax=Patella vulgata TaxID=6465 RepID=UPI0024A7D36F|nr:post-GPI attachment to proteins factor 4 [Patella vulgata]XP_050404384.2 post-GPI attachment to proteins factor 4 [Patella vulgata]XP_050404385.2 post-GPI attachment to proteins factor 4 [Patella vulgata]
MFKRLFTMFKTLISYLIHYLKRHSHELSFILFLFLLQFVVILPVLFWNKPWTIFFKGFPSKANYTMEESNLNTKRLSKAVEYFHSIDAKASLKLYDDAIKNNVGEIDMVVSIVTTKRKNSKITKNSLGYLLQSSAKVDKLVKHQTNFKSVFTTICNVDVKPEEHHDAISLKSYLPYVERYGNSKPSIPDLFLPQSNVTYRTNTPVRTFEKETMDYIFCLNAAKYWNPKYVLLLEDDGIVHDNVMDILAYVLKYRLGNFSRYGAKDFIHLKLFYPEKWQGYAFEKDRILELLSGGLVGGAIFILVYLLCNIKRRKHSLALIFTCGVLFTVLTCVVLGRQNIIELRRIHPCTYRFVSSPGCCTPAMLYPSSVIDELSKSLSRDASKPYLRTDLAINQFVQSSGLPAFYIEPNLVDHIGRVTTLGLADKPADQFLQQIDI